MSERNGSCGCGSDLGQAMRVEKVKHFEEEAVMPGMLSPLFVKQLKEIILGPPPPCLAFL